MPVNDLTVNHSLALLFFLNIRIMRLLIQRVKEAQVAIGGRIHSQISQGLLLLLGIEENDTQEDIDFLCKKVVQIRLFNDDNGAMNLSAQTKKGNRPSYIRAARPERAIPLYEQFIKTLQELSGEEIATGVFGADMQVSLCNDGPVTIFIDSKMRDF